MAGSHSQCILEQIGSCNPACSTIASGSAASSPMRQALTAISAEISGALRSNL
jgi:hypothetical protein